eukprot:scaffold2581_cov164-Pinguiococcus_pyrenoidosus.AAC.5
MRSRTGNVTVARAEPVEARLWRLKQVDDFKFIGRTLAQAVQRACVCHGIRRDGSWRAAVQSGGERQGQDIGGAARRIVQLRSRHGAQRH